MPTEVSQSVLEYVRHSDVMERRRAVPRDAMIRGLYFKSVIADLERRGLLNRFLAEFPDEMSRSTFRWYPATDFLLRVAFAGALVASPQEVYDGMRELFRANSLYFAKS